jgi:hypothetical protein
VGFELNVQFWRLKGSHHEVGKVKGYALLGSKWCHIGHVKRGFLVLTTKLQWTVSEDSPTNHWRELWEKSIYPTMKRPTRLQPQGWDRQGLLFGWNWYQIGLVKGCLLVPTAKVQLPVRNELPTDHSGETWEKSPKLNNKRGTKAPTTRLRWPEVTVWLEVVPHRSYERMLTCPNHQSPMAGERRLTD